MLGKKVRCNDCQHVFVVTHDAGLVDVTPTTKLPPHLRQEPVAVPLLRKPNWLLRVALAVGVVVAIGAVTFVILSYGWDVFKLPVSGSSATHQLTGTGDGKGPRPEDWGAPFRISDQRTETTFQVGLKDAWWIVYDTISSGEKSNKKGFLIAYYYKNLGPREGGFTFSTMNVEIKTDKGHIFSGQEFSANQMPMLFGLGPQNRDVGGWQPKETTKIEDTGESALVFEILHDETPAELIATESREDKNGNVRKLEIFDIKLPHGPFGSRIYTEVFGFLPQKPEEAVPGLIDALQGKDQNIRRAALDALGGIGPAAKDAVPAATKLLLRDESMDVRKAAAIMLGQIGPEAKEAIPALKRPFRESDPRGVLSFSTDFYAAVYEALVKVGGASEAIPTIREDLKHATAPSLAGSRSDQDAVFGAVVLLAPRVREVIPVLAEAVNDKGTTWYERIDGAKRLGEIGPAAIEAVPILKNTLLYLERTGAIHRDSGNQDLYDAIKEALPKIDPNWESVSASSSDATTPPIEEPSTGFSRSRVSRQLEAPKPPEEPSVSLSEPTKPTPPKEDNTAAEESAIKHEDKPTVFISSRSGFNFKIIEAKRGNYDSKLTFTMVIRSQNKTRLMKLVEPKETAYIVDPNGNKYFFVSAGGTLWTGMAREENKMSAAKPPNRNSRGLIERVRDSRQRRESNPTPPTPSYQKFPADVDIKCYMTFLAPPHTVKKINLVFTFAYDDGSDWWFSSNRDDALFKDLNLETLILDVPQDANKIQ